jgi:uncharacterized cupredoxin-like copper-binding protein
LATSTFDPSEIVIPADTDVTVRLVNVSPVLAGGEETTIVVNLPAGVYSIGCDVPGHRLAGMRGMLHVTP